MTPYVEWDADGHPYWFHICTNGLDVYRISNRWVDNKTDSSVAPSLICDKCGTHGFWTDGYWNSL